MLKPKSDKVIHDRQSIADREGFSTKYYIHAINLLTFEVLVQNRRRDKEPVLIFGSRSLVISHARTAHQVMAGRVGDSDRIVLVKDADSYVCPTIANFPASVLSTESDITQYSQERALCGVAYDPWDKRPRFVVTNFNGKEESS